MKDHLKKPKCFLQEGTTASCGHVIYTVLAVKFHCVSEANYIAFTCNHDKCKNHCPLLVQQVCHDGSTHHLFRRHVFCSRQVKHRVWQRYLLRARPLCCSQSMQGWHRHYSLLLQSRLGAEFEVLPNQSEHPSPWRTTELLKNPGPSMITTILRTRRWYGLAPLTDGCILLPITFPT